MQNQWLAYGCAASLIFLAALCASFLPLSYQGVIILMGLPSLFGGYYFSTFAVQYTWGTLLGVALYMGLEFMMYGPIYQISGPVYAAGFVLALACCLSGVWFANWKKGRYASTR